jgi:SAM-dependent MidA family methyltransferase
LPERYAIFELSPELRERQRRTIERHAGAFADRVQWIDRPPEAPFDGVILANEILDAFPVKIFQGIAGKIYERRVKFDEGRFSWLDSPADKALDDRVRGFLMPELIERDTGYISEVNIGTEPWVADLAAAMNNAVVLIVDYGFPCAEYYHPQRTDGTLMCHFRHSTHNDPFWCPGIQDITASVDFTWVAEAASTCGLEVLGYAEQASFLLSNDLLDDAQQRGSSSDESERQRVAYEIKMLTLPTEMGSRFKVMALGKGYDFSLRGFQRRDDRHRL